MEVEKKLGYIYKLVNNVNLDIYIGSTTNTLKHRLSQHFGKIPKQSNRKLYKSMIELGKDAFSIILIENVLYEDIKELKAREQDYIRELKPELNMYSACGRDKEKQKLKDKKSYVKHRDKRIQKVREYAETHKELIKEKGKLYRLKNADKIKQVKGQVCECNVCGKTYTHNHKSRHEKTQYHISKIPK